MIQRTAGRPTIEHVAAEVALEVAELFASADRLAATTARVWRDRATVRAADLLPLRPAIEAELATHDHYVGCGYVAALDALGDARRYWEWFRPGDEFHPRPQPVDLACDTGGGETYAYEEMEWYQAGAASRRALVGPYLDFACANRLVITVSRPMRHDGEFIGITGVDVVQQTFEPLLLRLLNRSDSTLAVLNADGRVIASNSADAVPTERLRVPILDETRVGGPEIGWRLAEI